MPSATELDLTGLRCPLPVIKARKALAKLASGEELSVVTTDPMAAIDIPHMCNQDGHLLVAKEPLDERRTRFLLRKG